MKPLVYKEIWIDNFTDIEQVPDFEEDGIIVHTKNYGGTIYYLNRKKQYHRVDGPARMAIKREKKYNNFCLNDCCNIYKEDWFQQLSEDEKILALFNADEWR